MFRRPPRPTRTYTLCPYTTLFRSDISLQVAAMDRTMAVEPKSVVHFDNLGTRMTLPDMRFFFYRWGRKLTAPSSRLFERRWGYNFYSEQSMYNWVVRR